MELQPAVGDVDVLNRLLQRIKPLTHLALLMHATHKDADLWLHELGEDNVKLQVLHRRTQLCFCAVMQPRIYL